MCQRPAFAVNTAYSTSSSSCLCNFSSAQESAEELSSALRRIQTIMKPSGGSSPSSENKRVRFQPPTLLNSFAEPTYSLNEECRHSMWWTRDELTPLVMTSSSPSQKSLSPSVSMCLIMFMISNLSILSIAACFLTLDD